MSLHFAHWEIDLESRELRVRGQLRHLEPRVFDVLAYLIEHRHRVVRLEELLRHAWGSAAVSDNVVVRAVMKARRAIDDQGGGAAAIRTLHRVGYRFVATPGPAGATPAVVPAAAVSRPEGMVALARHALQREQWRSASQMLQVAVDNNPDDAETFGAHLMALASAHDPVAFQRAGDALAHADRVADHRLALQAHRALAQAHMNMSGVGSEVRLHLDAALRLCAPGAEPASAEQVQLHTIRAHLQTYQGAFEEARALYARLEPAHVQAGDRGALAKIMNNRGAMDALGGNLLGARQWLERALRLAREEQLSATPVAAGANLAAVNAELGSLGVALEQCDSVAAVLPRLQDPRLLTDAVVTLCGIYAEASAVDRVDALVALLRGIDTVAMPALHGPRLMASAIRCAAAADRAAAITLMHEALRCVGTQEETHRVEQWLPTLLRAEMMAGRMTDADVTAARIRRLRSFDRSERLQGILLHADAVNAHGRGDVDATLRLLELAIGMLPLGRAAALARLDAAWLLAERGAITAAWRTLRDMRPWLEEHPLGQCVQRRLEAAQAGAALPPALLLPSLLPAL